MNTKSILLVSHDVGGANNIAYWAKELATHYEFTCYLDGPAKRVFSEHVPNLAITKGKPDLKDFDFIVTGSGWQSDFELNVIKEAKALSVPCGAYLDHWVNYQARFEDKHGNLIMPDEIWVADLEAYAIAQVHFSSDVNRIRLVRNRYLKCLASEYASHKRERPTVNLICLEPIRNDVAYEDVYHSLLQHLDDALVRIRLHPSNTPCGLELLTALLSRKNIQYEFSQSPLSLDFSASKSVYGYQSSVLVYSASLDIPTYSYYPSKILEPLLPHSSIHYI